MELAAVILGGPFAAFALLGILAPLRRTGRLAGYVSILGIGASFVASLLLPRPLHGGFDPAQPHKRKAFATLEELERCGRRLEDLRAQLGRVDNSSIPSTF